MQHFLNFLPLPHGQGSFRPTPLNGLTAGRGDDGGFQTPTRSVRFLAFWRERGPARQLFDGIAEEFELIRRLQGLRFAIQGALQILLEILEPEPRPTDEAALERLLDQGLSSLNPNLAIAACQPCQAKHSSCGCRPM